MRTDPGTSVVGSQSRIHCRIPAFDDSRNKLLHQVWVRATMACSLKERHAVRIINFLPSGKVLDRLDQQFVGIWHINSTCTFATFKNSVLLIFQLLPFERHLGAIDIMAFSVLPYHVE